MDWDKIIEISDFGMEVESHTINHADLPRLARTDWGAVLAEVVISKQILEERLGRFLRYFDYPLGRQDEEIQQLVQDAGYEAAVIIGPGVHQSAETPYALRRHPGGSLGTVDKRRAPAQLVRCGTGPDYPRRAGARRRFVNETDGVVAKPCSPLYSNVLSKRHPTNQRICPRRRIVSGLSGSPNTVSRAG